MEFEQKPKVSSTSTRYCLPFEKKILPEDSYQNYFPFCKERTVQNIFIKACWRQEPCMFDFSSRFPQVCMPHTEECNLVPWYTRLFLD